MAVLIGMSSTVKGQKYEITQDEIFLGRNTQNHFPLEDNSISGRHCSIVRDGRKYTLIDLGSTNGTRLNGSTIMKSPLRPKDIIQVGGIELMFDGQDVDIPEAPLHETAQIEVSSEPMATPTSFHTASPFGTRKDSRKPWAIITGALIVLALVALVYFFKNIFSS
jgi:pSer/pThr/pTyr-binding forkhead associated (FHA) protein